MTVHTPKQVSGERLQQIVAYVDLMGPNSEPCVPGDVAQSMAAELLTRRSSAGVKGLEWQKRHESEFLSRAETILGLYRVWSNHEANGEWFWSLSDGAQAALDSPSDGSNATEAEAKAACQADFNTRILSALEHVNETPKTEHVEGDVYSPSHAGEDDGAVAELVHAALNVFDKLASETATVSIFDQERLGDAIKATISGRHPSPSVPPQGETSVEQPERLKLHRKIMGMIADKQRYAGAMLSGRDLHVIAEALLDRAIETEKAALASPTLEPSDAEVEHQQFRLEWDAAPRPPVHPKAMRGRQTFGTFEQAVNFMSRQPADAVLVSLTQLTTTSAVRTNEAVEAIASRQSTSGEGE